jgi:ubiquinone/menaquinone biosynthesis C-methylase UbiE
MFRPSTPEPVRKDLLQEVASTYVGLCKAAVNKQTSDRFRTYIDSVIQSKATLHRHVRAFELYAPYLTRGDRILDWGCRHAPDACMIRVYLGDEVDLHGCDRLDTASGEFGDFFEFAKLRHKHLTHVSELPYDAAEFDVVLSSGVLEHVAKEQQSIQEIWRVLKPRGLFIITFLPNYFSLSERMSRLLGTYAGHTRLYTLTKIRDRLLANGFVIEKEGYHQVFPTFAKGVSSTKLARLGDGLCRLNPVFEKAFPLAALSANLYLIARKVEAM